MQNAHLAENVLTQALALLGEDIGINYQNDFSAAELSDLRNFNPGVDKDTYTITFPQHPCVILNALEVLGFRVVSSTPKIVFPGQNDSPYSNNESSAESNMIEQSIVWTLRKEFEEIDI